jgi:hypothetical protein
MYSKAWVVSRDLCFSLTWGHAVEYFVREMCYKREGRGFDSISVGLILAAALWLWGLLGI